MIPVVVRGTTVVEIVSMNGSTVDVTVSEYK